ncbi:type VII secretion protein EssA [Streptococcus sp. H31]|uniref:type VII secretion protein EssA n=1 Tax=Streptococcus huangxiaojuni TaxID=3237239 RepID=UPI0034A22486
MKIAKWLLFIGLLFNLGAGQASAAEKIKDNNLVFDDERLEREETDSLGSLSDLTAQLFKKDSKEQFKQYKDSKAKNDQAVLNSLFSGQEVKKPALDTAAIFLEAEISPNYARHQTQDTDSQVGLSVDSFTLLAVYTGLLILVLAAAGIGSYRISKGD